MLVGPRIGSAELGVDATQPGHPAVGVPVDGNRAHLELEDTPSSSAWRISSMRAGVSGAAPIDDRRLFGAEPARRADCVDGHVAATDHDHLLAVQDRVSASGKA